MRYNSHRLPSNRNKNQRRKFIEPVQRDVEEKMTKIGQKDIIGQKDGALPPRQCKAVSFRHIYRIQP